MGGDILKGPNSGNVWNYWKKVARHMGWPILRSNVANLRK
jgi:hypothetical protein